MCVTREAQRDHQARGEAGEGQPQGGDSARAVTPISLHWPSAALSTSLQELGGWFCMGQSCGHRVVRKVGA
jgi:hypothetical protein